MTDKSRDAAQQDIRCQCCGYMTYHREHLGCIRAALAEQTAQSPTPDWISYNKHSDVLTIRGRRYDAALFDERGFGSPPGTLLRIVDGPADVVTLERVAEQQDARAESPIIRQNKLLADALASCILASGIVRTDIDGLTGPQLLLFAEDLREMLETKTAQQDAQACVGCNGIGVVGNILDTVTCPFCDGSGNAAPTPPAQQKPAGVLTMRDDMGADIKFNRSFTLLPGQKFALYTAPPAQSDDEHLLRLLLAVSVAGVHLYADDGEMSDCSEQPHIDFKRDSVKEIERKLIERGMAKAWGSIGEMLSTKMSADGQSDGGQS